MLTWWPIVGVLFLILGAKAVLLRAALFARLRGFRLRPRKIETIAREETPPIDTTVLESVEEDLIKLGFHFERAAICTPSEGAAFETPLWDFLHQDASVRVTVLRLQLAEGSIARSIFETDLDDGRTIDTGCRDCRPESIEGLLWNETPESTAEIMFRSHLAFVDEHAGKAQPRILTHEELRARSARIWSETMKQREQRGDVVRLADDSYAFSILGAWRETLSLTAKIGALRRNKAARDSLQRATTLVSEKMTVRDEVTQFQETAARLRDRRAPRAIAIAFAALMLIWLGVLGSVARFSGPWQALFSIVGSFVFHECGHLLGLRIFAFNKLPIQYLPLVNPMHGRGIRPGVKPWKELVVYFLGPLPGFFIGLLIIQIPFFARWEGLGVELLILNLFLLLPLHFFDGGQIWDILLFRRFPKARAAFYGSTPVAFLACAVALSHGKKFLPAKDAHFMLLVQVVFVICGLRLLAPLRAQWSQARAIDFLRKKFGSSLTTLDEDSLLASIFEALREFHPGLKPAAKFATVSAIATQCRAFSAGAGSFIVSFIVYLLPYGIAAALLFSHPDGWLRITGRSASHPPAVSSSTQSANPPSESSVDRTMPHRPHRSSDSQPRPN